MLRIDFILPELGIGDRPIVASLWHVKRGSRVIEGDSLLEVLCGSATIDLPAPVSGTVLERLVREEDRIVVGQRLAVIEVDAEEM
jgi:pyruvate/2-oxoglutarate dehydrogenase complex dihydrolipoamide acyltransferase (E2) component